MWCSTFGCCGCHGSVYHRSCAKYYIVGIWWHFRNFQLNLISPNTNFRQFMQDRCIYPAPVTTLVLPISIHVKHTNCIHMGTGMIFHYGANKHESHRYLHRSWGAWFVMEILHRKSFIVFLISVWMNAYLVIFIF